MINSKDISFIIAHKRFPYSGILRKQIIFYNALTVLTLAYLLFTVSIYLQNQLSTYWQIVIQFCLFLSFAITTYRLFKFAYFKKIETETNREQNIQKIQSYFMEKEIVLYRISDNAFYASCLIQGNKKAKELIVFIFNNQEVLFNNKCVNTKWFFSGLTASRSSNFYKLVRDLSQNIFSSSN